MIIRIVLIVFLLIPVYANAWDLVWTEEFNYIGEPNPYKWVHEIGKRRNNESQRYTDSLKNSYVDGNSLVITAYKDEFGYTSGSLSTVNLYSFGPNTRIEARMTQPRDGLGPWSGFWITGKNYPSVGWPKCGEIDIVEYLSRTPGNVYAAIHYDDNGHVVNNGITRINNPEEFHVYAIEWTDKEIKFFVDGINYHTSNVTDIDAFERDFILRINLAIGGTFGGEIDNSIFPVRMKIDYIRVYSDRKKVLTGALFLLNK